MKRPLNTPPEDCSVLSPEMLQNMLACLPVFLLNFLLKKSPKAKGWFLLDFQVILETSIQLKANSNEALAE